MTPRDRNILQALHLLMLLWDARKQHLPKLDEQEQHKLIVTKENLRTAELTLPVFASALKTLDKRGYLTATFFITEKAYGQMREALDKLEQAREELRKNSDPEFSRKLQKFAIDFYEKRMPPGFGFDEEAFKKEEMTTDVLIDAIQSVLKDIPEDVAAIVVLLPFRNIERLLERMDDGMKFSEVQDAGIWYNPNSYTFHFQDKVFSAAYRGTAGNIHYVLDYLFNRTRELVVDYSDIQKFEPAITNKALEDAVRNFVKKKPELRPLFHIHSDRVELNSAFKNDIH